MSDTDWGISCILSLILNMILQGRYYYYLLLLLLFYKWEKWDKEVLKCLLKFIWLVRERRSQKVLTPKLRSLLLCNIPYLSDEWKVRRMLNLQWNNTCQCLTTIKKQASTTPKANLSYITRASCFALGLSPFVNTTFVYKLKLLPPLLKLEKRRTYYLKISYKLKHAGWLLIQQNHQRKRCSQIWIY